MTDTRPRRPSSLPTLAEADALFLDQAADYFRAELALWDPETAQRLTADLIADRLTERETGLTRRGLKYGSVESYGWWRSVRERHHADAVQVAERMQAGNWEGARDLLAHCLDVAPVAKRAT